MPEEAATTMPSPVGPAPENKGGGDKAQPKTWWQWLLVYPALAITLLSSIPTYVEFVGSKVLGVPFGQYRTAMKENELWQQNVNCAAAPFDGLKTKQAIEVDAVVCNSGNVLVRVNRPGASFTKYKWVPLDADKTADARLAIFPAAYAQSRLPGDVLLAQANFQVLCQAWVGNGLIRRVILNRASNSCFAEVVNTFNGTVISSSPSPCAC